MKIDPSYLHVLLYIAACNCLVMVEAENNTRGGGKCHSIPEKLKLKTVSRLTGSWQRQCTKHSAQPADKSDILCHEDRNA
jgi:hypothetical protein